MITFEWCVHPPEPWYVSLITWTTVYVTTRADKEKRGRLAISNLYTSSVEGVILSPSSSRVLSFAVHTLYIVAAYNIERDRRHIRRCYHLLPLREGRKVSLEGEEGS